MKKLYVFLFLLLSVVLSGCRGSVSLTDTTFFSMDTVITLRLPQNTAPEVRNDCIDEVQRLDALFSRTAPDSMTARFRQAETSLEVSDEYRTVLEKALSVSAATGGAFDPTLAPLTELWNITGEAPVIPSAAAVEAALAETGFERLSVDGNTVTKAFPALSLDLGGCAKGYACEQAVRLLRNDSIPYGIVSFGGNIGVFGKKPDGTPWRVGVRDPDSADGVAGYLSMESGFLSISGDYERYFERDGVRYHHIFDRETGYPARSGVRSAAVWAEDGCIADALSTAVFVMGWEKTLSLYDSGIFSFEALLYCEDGTTHLTPGLAARYEHASGTFASPQ